MQPNPFVATTTAATVAVVALALMPRLTECSLEKPKIFAVIYWFV